MDINRAPLKLVLLPALLSELGLGLLLEIKVATPVAESQSEQARAHSEGP
jgi:hypothetical protein